MISACSRRLRATLLAMLLLALAAPVSAQQAATSGSFRGRVTDQEGRPVAGVQVVARNESTGLQRGALTDGEGRFLIPLLAPGGPYTVRASSIGYRTLERSGYAVGAGDVVSVAFALPTEAVQIEAVEVVANAARIDATQGGVVTRVGPEQVENLPVNGRDFTDFLNLSPLVSPQPQVGTGGQFAIGGARSSGTNVQIDGTDANNIFFGENRGSSRTPFAFSLESIKEFQLITNGFDVEYGNYQGGVVNAVTKGGTNDFSGSAFFFFRDEALTADDFTGEAPQNFRASQFGFSFSGPIVRDKVHFFVSLDGQQKDQPIQAGTSAASRIPQASLDQFYQALESGYGVSNPSRYYGVFEQTQDNLVLFGRLDWNLNANHRLTLRQNFSDFEQANDRIGSIEAITNGGPFQDRTYSTVAELNSVLGAKAFNTLRFQWSYEDRPRPANPDGGYLPQITVNRVDGTNRIIFGGDGIIFRNRLEETKLQFIDNFTYRAGAHTLKLGTNNLLSNTVNEFWLLGNGSYTFNDLADFEANRPASFSRLTRACPVPPVANASGESVICPEYDVPLATFDVLEWSLYAQDDWQVTDRLLLTAGLRYGGTSFRDQPGKLPAVDSAFDQTTGIVPDFGGLSPRVAFTYDLGDQERLLRGGLGLLVGRAPTVLAGNVFQTERPLLSVFCTGNEIPTIDFDEWSSVPRGEKNPIACRSGGAPTGRPEHSLFSEEFELPRTLKANLGYEQVIGEATRVGIDLLFSETRSNFAVFDLNLRPAQFTLAGEDRPVFVPVLSYDPTRSASSTRLLNSRFDRIYYNVSEGEARAFNLNLEVDHQLAERVQIGARYGFNYAYDNSSFSCCTSGEGFSGEPTAGDPNFIGDPGDELEGTWGPSRFENRHVLVANFLYDAPFGIKVNGIWRSQSGNPWTPVVGGDINGDGISGNDRAMISRDLQFASAADEATLEQLLADFDCLADQEGAIASRNSCRNPWWHSLDLRLSKEINTIGGQRAELLMDAFNVLNGLNKDWGRFMGVYGTRAQLLQVDGYDLLTNKVVYTANETFGEEQPIGFDPFQFQVQLGVRYRF